MSRANVSFGKTVLGYLVWGIFFVWPCNLCVAEMSSYLPVRGSIFELAARFIDPAMVSCSSFAWGVYHPCIIVLIRNSLGIRTRLDLLLCWVSYCRLSKKKKNSILTTITA